MDDRMKSKLGVRDTSPVDEDAGGIDLTKRAKAKVSTRLSGQKRKRSEPTPAEKERKKAEKEAREKRLKEEQVKLIVAVDFGTTNTGLAFVSSTKSSKEVDVIRRWSGGQNEINEKCPTRIAFGHENGFDGNKWGFGIDNNGLKVHQWFKLLLDGATPKTDFDDELLQRCIGGVLMSLPEGMTAMELAQHFLKCVYQHIQDCLSRQIGKNAVEQTRFRYMVSLPATWSPAAREATRQAAQNAGFGTRERDELILIDEPEACAVAALRSTMSTFDSHTFEPGTCATIVDLGGGTTDLVTYKIVKTEPLKLEEACVGQGGKCGATAIERGLHALLEERFGRAFSELPATKIGAGSKFMAAFEDIKRGFGGVIQGKVYELPLWMAKVDMQGSEEARSGYNAEEHLVLITSEEVQILFEPVLEKAFELVKKQISRTKKARMPAVKTMVLCGGLASSAYVCDRFESFVKSLGGEDMELVVPKKPWSAIARGAAICGLENSPVLFRRSRDHIGLCVHVKFDEDKHDPEDRFDCPVRGPRALDQMHWGIKRGDKISLGMRKSLKAYVVIDGAEARKEKVLIDQIIYRCSKKTAPDRLSPGVVKMGTVTMDLSQFVQDERKRVKRATNKYPKRHAYDIEILVTTSSSKGVLEVTSKIGRRNIGSTTIEYEADPAWKGSLVAGDD